MEKVVGSGAEICCVCGRSVKPGSGNFVNRVPDCNTAEERKEMGRKYPEGEFVCSECDASGIQEEYLEIQHAIEHDDKDVQYYIQYDARKERMREIEVEYGAEVISKWLKDAGEDCDHEWISDGDMRLDCLGECYKKPVKCNKCGLLGDEVWMFSCVVRRDNGQTI